MATDDFFRSRLEAMIDRQHPLVVLTSRMPWSEIEAASAPAFEHKARAGKQRDGADEATVSSRLCRGPRSSGMLARS